MSQKSNFEEVEKRLGILEKENAELRESLKAISASEELHRATIENISDTVIITDDHGKFVYVCPNTHIIFGLSPAEVYQLKTIQALVNGTICDISELKQKNEIKNIEWPLTDKFGNEHYLLINAKSVNIQGGTNLYTMRDISAFKQAQENIKSMAERIDLATRAARLGIWDWDIQKNKLTWNDWMYELYGLKREDFLNVYEAWLNGLHPDDRAENDKISQQAIRGEIEYDTEFRVVWPDGTIRFIKALGQVLRDSAGNPLRMTGVNYDITELKLALEALHKERNFSENLIETAQVIILILDTAGRIVRFNPYLETLSGYALEEVRGKDWFSTFLPPINRDKIKSLFRKAIDNIQTQGDVNPIISKDGREILIEWYDKTLKDTDGNTIGLVSIGRDVTEHKKAEEALRESEEKYRLLVETANDAIFIAQDEVIKFPNPKTMEVTGYSERELSEIPFLNLIHPEDREMVIERYLQRLKGEHPPSAYAFRIINKAGDELWVQLNAALTTWENRPATINLIRDITEQRQLENQLRQSHKMESIGTLAGGIAHDFNNILGIILGNTELAMDDVPNWNPARLNLDEVKTATLRAKDVVRQLLSFARKTKLEKKPTDITPIVKESLKLLRSYIPTSIDIRQNISGDIDTILADPTQINQILINLLTNAYHAMPDGGIIEVTLENCEFDGDRATQYSGLHPGRYVHLAVSDTGHGIPPENIDHIFDPYFTTKDVGRGTGMGLAVVHGIVNGHNAIITVQSESGKGTTFGIFFPIIEKEPVVEIEIDETFSAGYERILLIDDEESIVRLGRQRLQRLGYNVEAITSPVEALAMFQSTPDDFDLVITDMTMPQLSGDQLAKELLKIRPDLPIIICTGFSEKMSPEKARKLGIKGLLMKPVEKTDLAKTIRKVLDAGPNET